MLLAFWNFTTCTTVTRRDRIRRASRKQTRVNSQATRTAESTENQSAAAIVLNGRSIFNQSNRSSTDEGITFFAVDALLDSNIWK